jgi:Ca2+-binding EF-hand superfamily protein
MPGALPRGNARKQAVGKKRADWVQTHSLQLAADEVKIKAIFTKYDVNTSEALEFEQLKAFLTDVVTDQTISGVSLPKNISVDVQDEDVKFILLTCDKDKSSSIKKSEVLFAIKVWTTYLEKKASIDDVFTKYDTDKSNSLDMEQLRSCLQELNNGEPVSDEEVKHVMTKGDVLGDGVLRRIEFLVALAAWYASAEVRDEKKAMSSMCAVL